MTLIRKPIAAGQFYPRFKKELISTIKDCFLNEEFGPGKDLEIPKNPEINPDQKPKCLGVVIPHAGYTYSGPAAAISFQALCEEGIPDTIILLGTSHTGYRGVSLMKQGTWETPMGSMIIDTNLAEKLSNNATIDVDDSAFNGFPHGKEHCIEVVLPFIQYAGEVAGKMPKIVPIKIGTMDLSEIKSIGEVIANVITSELANGKRIGVTASSDMTHYQPTHPKKGAEEITQIQYPRDENVMEHFVEMDIDGTFLSARQTSVCGPQTITTLLSIGKNLGYKNAKKLKYYTSYDSSGKPAFCNYSVGYFSGAILE